jgi:hypothetical protein
VTLAVAHAVGKSLRFEFIQVIKLNDVIGHSCRYFSTMNTSFSIRQKSIGEILWIESMQVIKSNNVIGQTLARIQSEHKRTQD